jgi:hypothetical protein
MACGTASGCQQIANPRMPACAGIASRNSPDSWWRPAADDAVLVVLGEALRTELGFELVERGSCRDFDEDVDVLGRTHRWRGRR